MSRIISVIGVNSCIGVGLILMVSQFQKREKKKLSVSSFLAMVMLILILVVAGFLVVSNIKIKQKREKINQQLAALKKEIDELQKKNEALQEGISRVGEEEYIEKVAREELNLQKKGEKVVGFVLPQEQTEEKENFWQPETWWSWIEEKINWLKSKL